MVCDPYGGGTSVTVIEALVLSRKGTFTNSMKPSSPDVMACYAQPQTQRQRSAIPCDRRSVHFFDEVAREAERFGYLNELISAHFGIIYRGRYYAPKIAYDEAYREYPVGHLILSKIMRDCARQAVVEYPMGVFEEWKTEWTREAPARTFQCIFNKGIRGRMLFAARFQIKPGLKKLMGRSRREAPKSIPTPPQEHS
jgi:Acetyltransferase (GNAT) domain